MAADASSKVLERARDEYQTELSRALHGARQSLTKLFHRDYTDRLLLLFSVTVFFSVVLYILHARLYSQ